MTAQEVANELAKYASDADAVQLQRYFKTGPGEYGEGDQFIGVRMPAIRSICKWFRELPVSEVEALLASPIHEHRLTGLVIWATNFKRYDDTKQRAVFESYLRQVAVGRVNNWDLVDQSSEFIVGEYLYRHGGDIALLRELTGNPNIWSRRVAMIATFQFTRYGDAGPTLTLAPLLFDDHEDLIHKAVGWMLRETGKRCDRQLLIDFLDEHATKMPRTTLRYAIEHLPETTRQHYLKMR